MDWATFWAIFLIINASGHTAKEISLSTVLVKTFADRAFIG
jgi:hypothetical protein